MLGHLFPQGTYGGQPYTKTDNRNGAKKRRYGMLHSVKLCGQSICLIVVFCSCPLVKKHADLFGSFLY